MNLILATLGCTIKNSSFSFFMSVDTIVILNSVVVGRSETDGLSRLFSFFVIRRLFQFSPLQSFLVILSLFQFSRPWSSPVVLGRNFSLVIFNSVVVGRFQSSFHFSRLRSFLVVPSHLF